MCTIDRTCDICAYWSATQWEQFVKKRSYIDRKKPSRPSGSVPPAPLASPRAETPSGVSQPGTSASSLSRPSGGQGKKGGSRDAPGIVSRRASSPPTGSRSSKRGGSASGLSSVARGHAHASLAPSGAGEGGVARSQRTCLARSAPRLSLTIPRRTLDDVGNCGRFWRTAPACYPLVVPDLRIVEHRRIRELVHGRVDLLTVAVFFALAPLPVRGQEVEDGHCRGRSLPVCGRVAIGGGLLTATALDVCALFLRETGLDPRINTDLAVTGRGLMTATGHVISVRVPLPVGEIGVIARSHTLSQVALVTARATTRLWAGEKGRLARRDQQEGAEAVVSQPPAVSEVSFAVTPAAGGAALSALPSAVQDLARYFLSLSGSSSLGAVGGVAGLAAPTARSGFSCALRLLQRHGWRSPSLVLSSRRRVKHYWSSSVFRGYGSGFLPPTSGRSFIGGASAWSCPLLRLTAVSLAFGLAFAVFCGSGGFPRGY